MRKKDRNEQDKQITKEVILPAYMARHGYIHGNEGRTIERIRWSLGISVAMEQKIGE